MPASAWSAATAGSKPAAVLIVPAPYSTGFWMASVVASFAAGLQWPSDNVASHVSEDAFSTDTLGFRDCDGCHSRICQVFWCHLRPPSFLARSSAIGEMCDAKYAGAESNAAAMSGSDVIACLAHKAEDIGCGWVSLDLVPRN